MPSAGFTTSAVRITSTAATASRRRFPAPQRPERAGAPADVEPVGIVDGWNRGQQAIS